MKAIPSQALDFANITIKNACANFKEIPEPLDWYEPSINMLYLEAVSSYIFGNYLSSLSTMLHLLEHSLKMAIHDSSKNGKFRSLNKFKMTEISRRDLFDILTCPNLRDHLIYLLESAENIDWWNNIARHLRNSVSHINFPNFLKFYNDETWQGDFHNKDLNPHDSGDWGFVFHRWGKNVATKFLKDSTYHLKILLGNTLWTSDESWWISQKSQYDAFFNYKWEYTNIAHSVMKLDNYYSSDDTIKG